MISVLLSVILICDIYICISLSFAFEELRFKFQLRHDSFWFSSKPSWFTPTVPLDETHLAVVRGLIHQEVSPKCVNEESSTERHSYNRQVNRSSPLQCQDLSQYWLDKIRKFPSQSTPLGVVQFPNICPCVAAEQLPGLVRRKVALLRAFTVGFEKVLRSYLLLLMALPGLIYTLLPSC